MYKQLESDGHVHKDAWGIQAVFDEDREEAHYFDAITGETITIEEHPELEKIYKLSEFQNEIFLDSVSGQPLEEALVRLARAKEMDYFESKKVWEKRPRQEAYDRCGKAPISVKWIDTNKGDDDCPNYRSRLVAREIRRHGENPIFAPTPPLESLRMVLSLAATNLVGYRKHVRDAVSEHRTQISFIDISRAYFCAATDPMKPTYVELPREDGDYGQKCGLLLKHMYGTRKAADGWHNEYAGHLVTEMGFEVGDASACVFVNKDRGLRSSVHGDDLTTTGTKKQLDWFKRELEKAYELKEGARLGPGRGDDREATVLNRVVRWTDHGIEYEADPRQQEKLLRDLKLTGDGVKGAATPGVKPTKEQHQQDQPLPREKVSPYRAVAARANFLAADRPELQFGAKEVCRWMSAPTELGHGGLKRLGRYVLDHKRLVYAYPWQEAKHVDTYSDTDWAGCTKTRKSTSGGCLLLGQHLLKSWSSTQTSVSLSSGGSEFYGVVKATGITLGFQALLRDVGHRLPIRVWTDSSATLGICGRQGLGKLRHLDTQYLWVQQKVRDGSVELLKVKGEHNPADLFTKHLVGQERITSLLELLNCFYRDGRAEAAPLIRKDAGKTKGELLEIHEQNGDVMKWDDRLFPFTEVDGEQVPEAYPVLEGLLPHMHPDLYDRFPRAFAADEPDDPDPGTNDALERRGREIGTNSARFAERNQRGNKDSRPKMHE